jgi:hypothetical protein
LVSGELHKKTAQCDLRKKLRAAQARQDEGALKVSAALKVSTAKKKYNPPCPPASQFISIIFVLYSVGVFFGLQTQLEKGWTVFRKVVVSKQLER